MRAFLVSLLVFDPTPATTTREEILISVLLDASLTLLYLALQRGGLL